MTLLDELDELPPQAPQGPFHWRWYRVAEVHWKRMGLGVEVSWGYWWPREWSASLIIGPLLLTFGIEEDRDD